MVFPTFFQCNPEILKKELIIWATFSSIFSSNTFFDPFLSSPSGNPIMRMLDASYYPRVSVNCCCYCFFCQIAWPAGSLFLNKKANPGPQQWKQWFLNCPYFFICFFFLSFWLSNFFYSIFQIRRFCLSDLSSRKLCFLLCHLLLLLLSCFSRIQLCASP